jgi:hypothetical protein
MGSALTAFIRQVRSSAEGGSGLMEGDGTLLYADGTLLLGDGIIGRGSIIYRRGPILSTFSRRGRFVYDGGLRSNRGQRRSIIKRRCFPKGVRLSTEGGDAY